MRSTKQRITWPTAVALFAVVTLSGAGCAYFNLFYNAETAFEEGERLGEDVDPRERPTQPQRTQYQRAIRKSQMLLDEYPDSDLVDDALFLMGKAHLRLNEWSDALRNLDNLLANFPNSEFVEEAMYLKSLAHLGRGEEQTGLDWFARLREAFPEGRFAAEALYRLGDAYAEDRRYDQAIDYYRRFLERHPDRREVSSVRLSLARLLLEVERQSEALEQLAQIDPEPLNDAERFEVERLLVETLIAEDRPEEAAELVVELSDLAMDQAQRDEAFLLEGRVLLEQGRVDEGIAALEELGAEDSQSQAKGEAWYTIVEYLVEEEGPDSELLAEKLEAALSRRLGPEWGPPVQVREAQLESYRELRGIVAADTTETVDRVEAAFELGELVLFGFERPVDALPWYERALELGPDTEFGPRSAYAIGYIRSEHLDDAEGAEGMYARLREDYPESPQARSLAGEEFLEPKERTREELEALVAARMRQIGAGGTGTAPGGVATDDPRFAPTRSLQYGGPGAFTPRERGG